MLEFDARTGFQSPAVLDTSFIRALDQCLSIRRALHDRGWRLEGLFGRATCGSLTNRTSDPSLVSLSSWIFIQVEVVLVAVAGKTTGRVGQVK
jgi:hypothetical protein